MGHHKNEALDRRDKRAAAKAKKDSWAIWVSTHTVMFTPDEIARLLDDEEHGEMNCLEFIEALTEVGMKTTFKWDRRTDQYVVNLFRDDPEQPDAGYAIQVKATSYDRCVRGLALCLGNLDDFNLLEVTALRETFLAAY